MKKFFIVLFVCLYSFKALHAQPSGRPSALELPAYSPKKNEQIENAIFVEAGIENGAIIDKDGFVYTMVFDNDKNTSYAVKPA